MNEKEKKKRKGSPVDPRLPPLSQQGRSCAKCLMNLHFITGAQGVYSEMYMTGALGPVNLWDTQKNKYQEKSDQRK